MRKLLAAALLLACAAPALAQEAEVAPPRQSWSFDGVFGTYDRAALQRGFQIYSEVCSNCHAMSLLRYRDLAALGYKEEEIKAIAAQKQVTAGPNDQGEMFQRPAQPADNFVPPFPNDQANRAAHNGALPPDLSLIVKQRDVYKTSALMVTHRLQDAFTMASHYFDPKTNQMQHLPPGTRGEVPMGFLILRDGKIIFDGDVHQLAQSRDEYIREYIS